ncbi:DNA repair protein [Alginatibacterium sediminis]|uniref:DNA repair protein n=1 Tax=Alginatibacterium sediminis TaxID=2164068 RepID=A0A420EHU3_9ALTE|nr:DNA repair protein [Alginatibacterium sediminis]RKF20227.1 DNA repair protein [Alginatibacterium sediminis]
MMITIVLVSVGALLFLVIAYNVTQQYKQQREAEMRRIVAKQKAIVTENEEILLNSSRLPCSKEFMLMIHNRSLNALKAIKDANPNVKGLHNRMRASQAQIKQIEQNFTPPGDDAFRAPDNDKDALQMLQVVKKMRQVLRAEHSRGRLNTQVFVLEDRRLELMQLKINIENAFKRAIEAQILRQWGTARQLLNKSIGVLQNLTDRDAYLERKLQELMALNSEMDENLKREGSKKTEEAAEKDVDELDVLFAPKKKW